ncbi:fibrinogen-like protein A [Apostichopus japonicus]|uniref:Fibrinogen-like protein A n=1 Tax=Stichopus japonicus TaxID=307972 RepID=A0A2G8LHC1_STIJA|nr:fibrinogen-like protein A [Apostichopus japonicus]
MTTVPILRNRNIGKYLFVSKQLFQLHTVNKTIGIGFLADISCTLIQQTEYPRDCKEVSDTYFASQPASGVYFIQPDAYPEPFEAYCDNDLDNGGWTVLQRRQLGSVSYNRTWEAFKNGFGFLGSDFWIGNDKIAFLTNQKHYQIRLEFENAAGLAFFITYDKFRISDEWGQYALFSIGAYSETGESFLEWCPSNEIFSSEACERSCEDPDTCLSSSFRTEQEKCVCVGDFLIQGAACIPRSQCNCFVADKGDLLTHDESYVNSSCTGRFTCRNNHLVIEDLHRCSDDATCDARDGVNRCQCIDGYEGDGVTCERLPMDCSDLYVDGIRNDGVYTIYPDGWLNGIQAYCEMTSNGGGWTFLQRRSSASVGFYRTWEEYKNGFEHPSRDHWLGYNAIQKSNSQEFSTHDRDNDDWSSYDCAEGHRGAWWFSGNYHCQRDNSTDYCMSNCHYCNMFRDGNDDCVLCANAHLNGVYGEYTENAQGSNIFWGGMKYGCSLQYTEMKIRPI